MFVQSGNCPLPVLTVRQLGGLNFGNDMYCLLHFMNLKKLLDMHLLKQVVDIPYLSGEFESPLYSVLYSLQYSIDVKIDRPPAAVSP